ncbi:MAG: hypothetical protein Q9161_003899 [Pseudevernia consocians]
MTAFRHRKQNVHQDLGKILSESSEARDPRNFQEDCQEDCLKGTTVELTAALETLIDSPLRDRLLAKLQKVFDTDEQFLPASDLDEILTSHAIEGELLSHGLEDVSSFVFRRAKKIFAILVVIRQLDVLQDLIKEELGDELLPLANPATSSLEDNKLRSALSKWDLDTIKGFFEFQWTLLSPIFSEGKHLKLDDDAILPFIKSEPIANGAYGGVHCVEIHSDHEIFEKLRSPTSQKVSLRSPEQLLAVNNGTE